MKSTILTLLLAIASIMVVKAADENSTSSPVFISDEFEVRCADCDTIQIDVIDSGRDLSEILGPDVLPVFHLNTDTWMGKNIHDFITAAVKATRAHEFLWTIAFRETRPCFELEVITNCAISTYEFLCRWPTAGGIVMMNVEGTDIPVIIFSLATRCVEFQKYLVPTSQEARIDFVPSKPNTIFMQTSKEFMLRSVDNLYYDTVAITDLRFCHHYISNGQKRDDDNTGCLDFDQKDLGSIVNCILDNIKNKQ